jgi:hypothetical protein
MHGGNFAAPLAAAYSRRQDDSERRNDVGRRPASRSRTIRHVNHFPRQQLLMTKKSHPFKLRLTACLCAGILGAVSAFSIVSAAPAEDPLVLESQGSFTVGGGNAAKRGRILAFSFPGPRRAGRLRGPRLRFLPDPCGPQGARHRLSARGRSDKAHLGIDA